MGLVEARKEKIKEIEHQIQVLSSELKLIKKSCAHEYVVRVEDYAYCEICGEQLGWWGLYIS